MKKQLSENALQVARARYFMGNHEEWKNGAEWKGEDWEACAKRVATTIAEPETSNKQKVTEMFEEMINNMDFLPGGRILRNCGRAKGSLFNCYHLPIGDNIEEIGTLIKDSLILWSEGGGVGCNFSPLRPKGDPILGKGGHSSGLVSFIEATDAVAKTIESGGGRRAAIIGHVDVSHPEIMDFIDAKLVHNRLPRINISVVVNNEFLECVEADRDWEFKFKQKSYGKIKAREIWSKIVSNMVRCAEPGLINWSNFAKNNSYYFSPVMGTNPCGETTLGPYEACDLGSLVIPNFITGNVNTNWKKLDSTIKTAVRFLDNVIDVNKYTLKEIDINVHKSRRVGIGILGLADYLFAKKVAYGSDKALIEVERLMRFIRDSVYQASVELAVEKGAFPQFEPVAYGKASFIRKLPAELRMDIKKHGIRNCTLMALAPTGTISLLTDYMSAIEPLFAKAYLRKDRVSERIYLHPKYREILQSGEATPDWLVDSFDLTPKDHFETQAICQKYCDASVSKTINLPRETTEEDLSSLLLEYVYDLKGVTVYRDGSRGEQPLNKISEEKVREYLASENTTSSFAEEDVKCASGACEL
jgi:ribonucleoside-diphosphate reductase alpha chain